jgi:hydroxymethylglutaryl-CoA reductase
VSPDVVTATKVEKHVKVTERAGLVQHSSRIEGFRQSSMEQRLQLLAAHSEVSAQELAAVLVAGGLDAPRADQLIENAIGTFALPFGVALNFKLNGEDVLVPMVIEEPSVIAAASNAAKLVRQGGGFTADSDESIMIAQIQLLEVRDVGQAMRDVLEEKSALLAAADAAQPGLKNRGGGARDLEARLLDDGTLVIHLYTDCVDAMGANAVNTMAEAIAPRLGELAQARVGLRILSNLADRRCVRVSCEVPFAALAESCRLQGLDGALVAQRVEEASRFAEIDPYRAATHNKGIMNGLDAAALATGQDWRSLEAGAHAYASRHGRYEALASWRATSDRLIGKMELPMAVGTVGGGVTVHPTVQVALRLCGSPKAKRLGQILAAAGLASNLAALRALATEGIQRGHMSLHHRRFGGGKSA